MRVRRSWLIAMFSSLSLLCGGAALRALAQTCAHSGPITAGCGSGENACVGVDEAACESDTARTLQSGDFACGTVSCQYNCVNSASLLDVCYIDYNCDWNPIGNPRCFKDMTSADEHEDWVKVSDECPTEECL
jgi:hypothetical protein